MKHHISPKEYHNALDKFKNQILESFSDSSMNFQNFVRAFLAYIPIDYLKESNINLISNFISISFDRIKKRDSKKHHIKISKQDKEDNYTIITLIANDMPFIVDSVKNLLSKFNLEVHFLFHPVIHSSRDKNGDLTSIDESKKTSSESFVFIAIPGILDDDLIKKIETNLEYTLDAINNITNSSNDIFNKVVEIANNLNTCPTGYDCSEIYEYIQWLQDDNFNFISYFYLKNLDSEIEISSKLGFEKPLENENFALTEIVNHAKNSKDIVSLGKLNYLSPIHQKSYMDYILIKNIDHNGDIISWNLFLGIYEDRVHYTSVRNIPIIRKKLDHLIERSPFEKNGYNYQKLVNIVESLPKEFLFRISNSDLYIYTTSVLSSLITKKLSVIIKNNFFEGFTNCLIFLPASRLTPETHESVSQYLSIRLNRKLITAYYDFIGKDFGYIYLMFEGGINLDQEIDEIESEINLMTSSWYDSLRNELIIRCGRKEGIKTFKNYSPIFSKEYKDRFFAHDAIEDLEIITKIAETHQVIFNLKNREKSQILKIYSPNTKLSLSQIIPFIENLGFKAIEEQTFYIAESDLNSALWIHCFNIDNDTISEENFHEKKHNIESALNKMYYGMLANDSLCKLVILADMDWWKINILRALTRYLHQTGFMYGKGYVQLVLTMHYEYTNQLIDLFEAKFNPETHSKENITKVRKSLNKYLTNIKSSSEDKVLRSILGIIDAMLRTNFYQKDFDNQIKQYTSFKFDCSKVPNLPMPLPHAEIYVYSSDFEGIHLRGGKVARGGLRWSDRGEDYRTEVLGLMKSQMTKNSVIVPVGSKGAFFVKSDTDGLSRSEYQEKVVECYKNFLRGLLDLTDNIVNKKTITPDNLIKNDDLDPYLVVAADKGTATFSDYANQISKEYNFWLDDAFASGGSVGYDHKKMGITAKGAWIAVERHFREQGINVAKDSITVVGVGDMSGDVFGNGMLLSKAIKLVAAFNHLHIFVDPNPDPSTSYKERQRLFTTAGSSWKDYDSKVMSQGGMIFERSMKSLKLNKEIKQLLDLEVDNVTPEELIVAILKSRVDLFWNGGIGTYIKSSTESHIDVGDKANDILRVNANELRLKAIGEGGNLGISQLGRIEFAKCGGYVNTDFIDNSAGVDCSDHEVNIKIALSLLEKSGDMSREERDILLQDMENEVGELVLIDNKQQTLALSIMEKSTISFQTESFIPLLEELEKNAGLKRKVEFLPSNQEIQKIIASEERLTRPELSVILSYSKMLIYNNLEKTKIVSEPFLEKYLIEYFPTIMREKFRNDLLVHPLKNEIILTALTNEIVNRMGGSVINAISKESGSQICDIVRSYIIVSEIFKIGSMWNEIDDFNISDNIKIQLYTELNKLLRRGVCWFLSNFGRGIQIAELLKTYQDNTALVTSEIEKFLLGEAKNSFNTKLQFYHDAKTPEHVGKFVAKLDTLISALDVTLIAEKTKQDHLQITKVYFEVGDAFHIDYLRKCCEKLLTNAYWNRLALQSIKDDLYNYQRKLTGLLKDADNIETWFSKNNDKVGIYNDFILQAKAKDNVNLNIMILALKKLKVCLKNI